MASLIIVASLGLAGAAYIAKRSISRRPGGIRLYVQRKNIYFAHQLGLLDDVQAAAAYDALRKHYEKLVIPKPVNLSGDKQADSQILYGGPFQSEMTKKEARQILGLSEEQSRHGQNVTRQWRQLMLRNHPDIGGSPYIAAKINEAKDIVMGEKAAKEDEPVKRDANEKKRGTKTNFDVSEEEDFTDAYQTAESRGPFAGYNPLNLTGDWNVVEEIFQRKANRKRPLWMPEDVIPFAPEENWKLRYLKELDSVSQLDEHISNQSNVLLMENRNINTKDTVGIILDEEGKPEDPRTWNYYKEEELIRNAEEVEEDEIELERQEKMVIKKEMLERMYAEMIWSKKKVQKKKKSNAEKN
ncbi:uncharacterized protein LOC126316713 [Schistocerca gregaria]|uniref:uncharacterized protein LOC126316713 n=1 Tax=Schistocerca gregaria TaxID=7010 RepID=UPI00211E8171|nr:uncharacterized protein LOC126316713 [Schistocerca gregaria]